MESIWAKVPIVWLAGVRRSGKTTLAESLPDCTLVNCDLPSSRAKLEDPEWFFENLKTRTVVFDEIHQLSNPSELLKLGADCYGHKHKILATGSSTLAATTKFTDSLTGRKRSLHFLPVLPEECAPFGVKNFQQRLLKGGLPPALMSDSLDLDFYSEWIDSFYARDIQELFRIEKRQPFIQLVEILLRQNGGLAEPTNLAKMVGLSRPTIIRYLEALETTQAITILRPYYGGGKQELISQPKIYGFDTGFVAFARGWTDLRPEDCGQLLENLTLESLQAIPQIKSIHYWRTKQQNEIDFIIPLGRDTVHAVECKWKADQFSPDAILKFRENYPKGENFLVCLNPHKEQLKINSKLSMRVVSILDFRQMFQKSLGKP